MAAMAAMAAAAVMNDVPEVLLEKSEVVMALDRALKSRIYGVGFRPIDHAPVYAVSSDSEPNLYHLVTVEKDNTLSCTCKGHQGGHYCQHRAIMHIHLGALEIARQRRKAKRITPAKQTKPVSYRDSVTAPLMRDTSPISIFK